MFESSSSNHLLLGVNDGLLTDNGGEYVATVWVVRVGP